MPQALGSSASVPMMRRLPAAEAGLVLPRVTQNRQLHPRPSPARRVAPRAAIGVSSWPAGKARGGPQQPDALAEIEQFLSSELSGLDAKQSASAEIRLQPHMEAFDLFIAHFDTYAGPLSAIKHAYEARITELEKAISGSGRESANKHREFLQTHERITSSLNSQLGQTQAMLAAAQREIQALRNNEDILPPDEAEPTATAAAPPPTVGCRCSLLGAGGSGVAPPSGSGGASGEGGSGGKWSVVAKALDTNPDLKIGRLVKQIARLATTPELLAQGARELLAMMEHDQLGVVFGSAIDGLKQEERVAVGMAACERMGVVERASFLEQGMLSLSAAERASVIEPLAIGLGAREKEAVFSALLVTSALGEDERLGLARQVLLSAPPRKPTKAGSGEMASESSTEAMRRMVFHEESRLAHSDGMVGVLLEAWGEVAPERIIKLVEALDSETRKETGVKMIVSAVTNPLNLEQALEYIYMQEDEEVIDDPVLAAELLSRRRQSSIARNLLREGKVPRMVATAERLCPLVAEDDPLNDYHGGVKLTCDCARLWVMPSELLIKVQGERLNAGKGAPPLSIRRYEDTRFETVEQREARESERMVSALPTRAVMRSMRSVRKGALPTIEHSLSFEANPVAQTVGKAAWHMSSNALLTVVAELWAGVVGELARGSHLGYESIDVAATLWEMLLLRHGLKSVAQRALADLIVSLRGEARLQTCRARLRLAAEMIGLGGDENPWSVQKVAFFFWLLPLTLPLPHMGRSLAALEEYLPLAATHQLLQVAVLDPDVRESIARTLAHAAIHHHTHVETSKAGAKTVKEAADSPKIVQRRKAHSVTMSHIEAGVAVLTTEQLRRAESKSIGRAEAEHVQNSSDGSDEDEGDHLLHAVRTPQTPRRGLALKPSS